MSTKIRAAQIATKYGIPVCLSALPLRDVRVDFTASVYEGFAHTHFCAADPVGSAKKHWIAYEAVAHGKIVVDDGARKALTQRSVSLLAPGVVGCEGSFRAGDIIEVVGKDGCVFAKGKTNLSAQEVKEGAGKKIKREVVHRDHLVILG
jgi:glutamate 5-kinase